MSNVETVWYENTIEGTLHQVVKGSDHEKRIRKAQREVEEEVFEPVYKRATDAQVKKAQESPEKQPGFVSEEDRARRSGRQTAAPVATPSVDVDALVAQKVAEALAAAGVGQETGANQAPSKSGEQK